MKRSDGFLPADNVMRHIYIGLSKRTWCGKKISRDNQSRSHTAPITEGEYIDGIGHDDLCPECVEAIKPIRGEPASE